MNKSKEDYFRNHRISVSDFLNKGPHRILDVGCGARNFGAFLKQNGFASEVVGIEMDRNAANEALSNLDNVYCVDLNQTRVGQLLSLDSIKLFDYIVCADVLEHLIDPWQTLSDLSAYLSPQGRVVVSIPNARHWTLWLPLVLKGRWNYQNAGIIDRTHLRFFTRATIYDLFSGAGLAVVKTHPLIGGKWRLVDRYSLHLLRDIVAVQWVFVGVPKS